MPLTAVTGREKRSGGLPHAGIHRLRPMSNATVTTVVAILPNEHGTDHGRENPGPLHTTGRLYQPQTQSALHDFVQCVAIGNVDACAARAELRERGELPFSNTRLKHGAQRAFDQFRHGPALSCRLALQLAHYHFANIKRCLHMDNHMTGMDICQPLSSPRSA